MTARMVSYATIHDPRNGAWHREQPLGIPACGVPLRRPHRAFAIDATSDQLCASCWPAETVVKSPSTCRTLSLVPDENRETSMAPEATRKGSA